MQHFSPRHFALAKPFAAPAIIRRVATRDALMSFDQRTIDSTGVFLIGELEKLDPTINAPLVDYQWGRDMPLREDVTVADEVSSFTNSTFAAVGGINPAGKSWIGKTANQISGLALDIGKTSNPLTLWGQEISYTLPELMSAQQAGRPVDAQKAEALNLKYQMDVDEQVYIGDTTLNQKGLVNATAVSNAASVATGVAGYTFALKTADEILKDFNEILQSAWAASGWKIMPNKVLLPPTQYGLLTRVNSAAGSQSIMAYLKANNIVKQSQNIDLDIQPSKWLVGRGSGGTDRMVAYNQDRRFVRFPKTALQRTPLEYRSLYQMTTYYGRLGVVEFPYPETLAYRDGI